MSVERTYEVTWPVPFKWKWQVMIRWRRRRMNGTTACVHVHMCLLFQLRAFPHGPGRTATACRPHGSRAQLSWSWRPMCCSRCSAWAGRPMVCSWQGGWAARGTTAAALAAHRSGPDRGQPMVGVRVVECERVKRSAWTFATTGPGSDLVAARTHVTGWLDESPTHEFVAVWAFWWPKPAARDTPAAWGGNDRTSERFRLSVCSSCSSPQDTVVALQALASFAALTAANHDVTVRVKSDAMNTVATFHIHHGNQMLQQSQQVKERSGNGAKSWLQY